MARKWIRDDKRLAIIFRDAGCCAYCGGTVEQGCGLTLDHIVPRDHGGTNHETNLITCCTVCNSKKGTIPLNDFLVKITDDNQDQIDKITGWILDRTQTPLKPFRHLAKDVLASDKLVNHTGNFQASKNGGLNGKGK